jgi:hypothetical protein
MIGILLETTYGHVYLTYIIIELGYSWRLDPRHRMMLLRIYILALASYASWDGD